MKKTLVIGASHNSERYAYKAISMLQEHKYPVEAIGRKEIEVLGIQVHKEHKAFEDINTITLYVNPKIQQEYYDYILSLKPQRVIFNPGTENPEFYPLLEKNNISYEEACTLVLLTTGQY